MKLLLLLTMMVLGAKCGSNLLQTCVGRTGLVVSVRLVVLVVTVVCVWLCSLLVYLVILRLLRLSSVLKTNERLLDVEVVRLIRRVIRFGELVRRIIVVFLLKRLKFSWKLSGALVMTIRLVLLNVVFCVCAISSGRDGGRMLCVTLPVTIGTLAALVNSCVVLLVLLVYMLSFSITIGCCDLWTVVCIRLRRLLLGLTSAVILEGVGGVVGANSILTGMLMKIGLWRVSVVSENVLLTVGLIFVGLRMAYVCPAIGVSSGGRLTLRRVFEFYCVLGV